MMRYGSTKKDFELIEWVGKTRTLYDRGKPIKCQELRFSTAWRPSGCCIVAQRFVVLRAIRTERREAARIADATRRGPDACAMGRFD